MKVMVNGLPGKMASEVANNISADPDSSDSLKLIHYSLTGPEITQKCVQAGKGKNYPILLIQPYVRDDIEKIKETEGSFLSVDFTQPDAVNENIDFYCRHNLPVVVGTTGGDRSALEERVKNSGIVAVVAPNMAKQIVAFQNLVQEYAEKNPNALQGCELKITESHQKEKKDTSGTAKAMIDYFNKLGASLAAPVKMIRQEDKQRQFGVPAEYLAGHGGHIYELSSGSESSLKPVNDFAGEIFNLLFKSAAFETYSFEDSKSSLNVSVLSRQSRDNTVFFRAKHWPNLGILQMAHNVNGRAVYASGTLDALRFLKDRVAAGEKGKVYSMIDVLSAGH